MGLGKTQRLRTGSDTENDGFDLSSAAIDVDGIYPQLGTRCDGRQGADDNTVKPAPHRPISSGTQRWTRSV
jgi:hypothetical protein